MRWRARLAVTTLSTGVLSLGTTGCFAPKKTFVPPPVPQVAAKAAPEPRIEEPPPIETPLPPIDIPAITLDTLPEMEAPASKPAPKRAHTPAPPATTPTPSVPTPETEPTVPAPPAPPVQLSEILTEDRLRQYEADFAKFVSEAQAALNRASGRRALSARQKQDVQRINTFLGQAAKSKANNDLVTAVHLAQRANLLGQDLLNSLQ
jgi:hypothetical protein